jgi:hypothetical protein
MQSNDSQQLHDRATRGETLTPAERAQLEAWYAEQDRQEAEAIACKDETPSLGVLQAQVDDAISRLRVTASQIEKVAAENAAIRQEIAVLQNQLARTTNEQPA